MTSAVIITPAAAKPQATAFAIQMGWQDETGDTFSVPLVTDGTVTHYGCRADVGPTFLALMADPPDEAKPLLAALIIDLSDTLWGRAHWDAVLTAQGLAEQVDPL